MKGPVCQYLPRAGLKSQSAPANSPMIKTKQWDRAPYAGSVLRTQKISDNCAKQFRHMNDNLSRKIRSIDSTLSVHVQSTVRWDFRRSHAIVTTS